MKRILGECQRILIIIVKSTEFLKTSRNILLKTLRQTTVKTLGIIIVILIAIAVIQRRLCCRNKRIMRTHNSVKTKRTRTHTFLRI